MTLSLSSTELADRVDSVAGRPCEPAEAQRPLLSVPADPAGVVARRAVDAGVAAVEICREPGRPPSGVAGAATPSGAHSTGVGLENLEL